MVSCQAVGTTWPSLVAFRLTDSVACRLENKKKTKAVVTLVSMTWPILCGLYLFLTFASSPDIFPIRSGYMNESVKTGGQMQLYCVLWIHIHLVSPFEQQILTITTCWYGEPDPLIQAQNKQASCSCWFCGVLNGNFLAETRAIWTVYFRHLSFWLQLHIKRTDMRFPHLTLSKISLFPKMSELFL